MIGYSCIPGCLLQLQIGARHQTAGTLCQVRRMLLAFGCQRAYSCRAGTPQICARILCMSRTPGFKQHLGVSHPSSSLNFSSMSTPYSLAILRLLSDYCPDFSPFMPRSGNFRLSTSCECIFFIGGRLEPRIFRIGN